MWQSNLSPFKRKQLEAAVDFNALMLMGTGVGLLVLHLLTLLPAGWWWCHYGNVLLFLLFRFQSFVGVASCNVTPPSPESSFNVTDDAAVGCTGIYSPQQQHGGGPRRRRKEGGGGGRSGRRRRRVFILCFVRIRQKINMDRCRSFSAVLQNNKSNNWQREYGNDFAAAAADDDEVSSALIRWSMVILLSGWCRVDLCTMT